MTITSINITVFSLATGFVGENLPPRTDDSMNLGKPASKRAFSILADPYDSTGCNVTKTAPPINDGTA